MFLFVAISITDTATHKLSAISHLINLLSNLIIEIIPRFNNVKICYCLLFSSCLLAKDMA